MTPPSDPVPPGRVAPPAPVEMPPPAESRWPLIVAGCAFLGLIGCALIVVIAAFAMLRRGKAVAVAVPTVTAVAPAGEGDDSGIRAVSATSAPELQVYYGSAVESAGDPPEHVKAAADQAAAEDAHCSEDPSDPACPHGGLGLVGSVSPAPGDADISVVERAMSSRYPLRTLVENQPASEKEQLVVALELCVHETRYSYRRRQCLAELAGQDRARAQRAAQFVTPDTAEGRELAAALKRYPSQRELEEQMLDWGLLQSDWAERKTRATPPLAAPRALVTAAGTADTFDVETGAFPNEHDVLLRRLARLSGGGLDGVLFEEVAPEMDSGHPYQLIAYDRGKVYRMQAQDHGDWYDLQATIGLLNTLARARKLPIRFVALHTDDQLATVVAAPEAGLRAAVEAGLFEVSDSSAAMDAGKAFEEQVLRALEGLEQK